MNKNFDRLLDLLYPRRCIGCDEPTDRPGEGVCSRCVPRILYIREPYCFKCGKPLAENTEYCRDCSTKKHFFISGRALYDYGSISDSLFRFKYGGRKEYAETYGKELFVHFKDWLAVIKPDALIPVPIHSSKKRKRGYNQAELIADALSDISGIPVCSDLILRQKKTLPLKDLSPAERQNNLKKAFKICQNDVKLSTIIIIDDIYTTGSTVDAMTVLLREAGVQNVYFLTLAIGRGL